MKYKDVTGDMGKINLDFDEIALSGQELLQMVSEWRARLGMKCGVLDNYLAGVLNAMIDTNDARNAAEEGFDEAVSELRRILRHIKEGKIGEAQKHPFYPTVKAYMDNHPHDRDFFYYDIYCLGLFPKYLAFSVQRFLEDSDDQFQLR